MCVVSCGVLSVWGNSRVMMYANWGHIRSASFLRHDLAWAVALFIVVLARRKFVRLSGASSILAELQIEFAKIKSWPQSWEIDAKAHMHLFLSYQTWAKSLFYPWMRSKWPFTFVPRGLFLTKRLCYKPSTTMCVCVRERRHHVSFYSRPHICKIPSVHTTGLPLLSSGID